MASYTPVLSKESVNPKVLKAEYAVRGKLVIRAQEHAKAIKDAADKGQPSPLPFAHVTLCNIGRYPPSASLRACSPQGARCT